MKNPKALTDALEFLLTRYAAETHSPGEQIEAWRHKNEVVELGKDFDKEFSRDYEHVASAVAHDEALHTEPAKITLPPTGKPGPGSTTIMPPAGTPADSTVGGMANQTTTGTAPVTA